MVLKKRHNDWKKSVGVVVALVFLVSAHLAHAGITKNTATEGEISVTGQLHFNPSISVWGASYGSDGSRDFSFKIGDTVGANDRTWLNYASTVLFEGKVVNTDSRTDTFLFPIARYQLCVDSNNAAGARIKVTANRFVEESPGVHFVPMYVEITANGSASSGNQSLLVTHADDSGNLSSKTIRRYKDDGFNADGNINHDQQMAINDWTDEGHNGEAYTAFTIKSSDAYVALNHYAVGGSGYDLERDKTVAADPNNFKYDETQFKDADACPVASRINVYLYIDLAALLAAPGASYTGSVNIDFSTTNT